MRGSGERLHGMQEVSGSIPLFSTKKTLHSLCGVFLFLHVCCVSENRKMNGAARSFDDLRRCPAAAASAGPA